MFDTATGAQLQLASANVATDSIAALANDLNPALPVINEERRLAFAALVGVLVLTQQVIMVRPERCFQQLAVPSSASFSLCAQRGVPAWRTCVP